MNTLIRSSREMALCKYTCRIGSKRNKYNSVSYSYSSLRHCSARNTDCTVPYCIQHRNIEKLSRYIPVLNNYDFTNYDNYVSGSIYFEKPAYQNSIIGRRNFHLNYRQCNNKPSSKVEATVQTMKDKQKEKVEEIIKEAVGAADVPKSDGTPTVAPIQEQKVVIKKSLKTRIWEELVHYYHGFRLLFIDINICRKLLWRVLNGKTLTRRENKLLVRTTSDLFRLIPFSVFIIVPFMELLLPLFIKFFPGMLPSTFQSESDRDNKLQQHLTVKLEMAKFLQKTLDEMAVQHKDHKSEEAKQFAEFFERIKDPNAYVSSEEITKYAKRFENEVTLDSLSRDQLSALCRLLEVNTMGTTNLLRFQLRLKLRSLAADDRVIAREGVNALDLFELQQACKARGMRAYGLTSDRLRSQLQEWIDLSLNEKVPQTLLLLSRAMHISDEVTTTAKLMETIKTLPDAVAAQTKASIGEREGKIDNKTKIEIIKEEERKIKEEREEEREEKKSKAEILLDGAPAMETSAIPFTESAIEAIVAKSQITEPLMQKTIIDCPTDSPKIEENNITPEDLQLLSEALKSVTSDNKSMAVEKGTIKDIKEELEDYKEDVAELREVRDVVKEPVRETTAAKILFKKVNAMIDRMEKVVNELEKQKKLRSGEKQKAEISKELHDDTAIHINDLIATISKFKQTSDESRLNQIENILSKLDTDKDGVISLDEVLKVIEALGRENVNLTEKQIEELITLLDKEQLIQAEERIEKAMAKTVKDTQKLKDIEETKLLAEAVIENEEFKDTAPVLKDNAKELNETTTNILQDHPQTTEKKRTATGDTTFLGAATEKDKLLSKTNIQASIPTTIPPPRSASGQANPKDKML